MLSAICSNLDQSKILLSGNGFKSHSAEHHFSELDYSLSETVKILNKCLSAQDTK